MFTKTIYLFTFFLKQKSTYGSRQKEKKKKEDMRSSPLLQTSLLPTIMLTSDLVSRENQVTLPFESGFNLLSSSDHHLLHEHKVGCPQD